MRLKPKSEPKTTRRGHPFRTTPDHLFAIAHQIKHLLQKLTGAIRDRFAISVYKIKNTNYENTIMNFLKESLKSNVKLSSEKIVK